MKTSEIHIVRDSREQEDGAGWWWDKRSVFAGTIIKGLKTGDYTLEGFEDSFVIERKSGVAEIAANVTQERFERELERLDSFKFPFLIAECTWEDVYRYPVGTSIPRRYWPSLRNKNKFIIKRLCEFQLTYKTKFIFAGKHAKEVATSLFKRVLERETTLQSRQTQVTS